MSDHFTSLPVSSAPFVFLRNYFCFVCVGVCLHACVSTMCVPGVLGGQEEGIESLEIGVTKVVNCLVGYEDEPWSSRRAAHALTSLLFSLFISSCLYSL